jgi:hypothetical protein
VAVYVYTTAAAFCILFNYVYSLYAHGVSSDFMTYMFLFPLLGGSLVFMGFYLLKKRVKAPSRLSFNLYNSGIAWLTVGSCIKGVMEIAGYESDYVTAFFVIGFFFLFFGLLACIIQYLEKKPLDQ